MAGSIDYNDMLTLHYLTKEICSENFENAAKVLKTLYNANVDNAMKIMQEIRNSPLTTKSIRHFINGYRLLFEEMQKNGHLSTYQAFLLKARIRDAMNLPNFKNIVETKQNEAKELLENLEEPTSSVVDHWKDDILNENYEDIVAYARQHYYPMKLILRDLVEYIFDKDKHNISKLIKFSKNLPHMEQTVDVLETVFKLMQRHEILDIPEILQLGCKVKEIMDSQTYKKLTETEKYLVENLKNNLPEPLKQIIWKDVYIKNVQSGQYLTPSMGGILKDDQRTMEMADTGLTWHFETVDKGETFRLKSVVYQEYLFPGTDKQLKDLKRRHIFTCRKREPVETGDWIIEPVDNCSNFLIKSKTYDEYLCASASKHAHTFRMKGQMPRGVWRIKMADPLDHVAFERRDSQISVDM